MLKRSNTKPPVGKRLASFLDKFIFFGLLALTVLVAIPYGTVDPWWESAFSISIYILGVLWVAQGLLSGTWLVPEHRLLIPVLALGTFCMIQSLNLNTSNTGVRGLKVWQAISSDPYETRYVAFKIFAITLAGIILLRYTTSLRRLRVTIYTIIGVGVISAFFGILRQTTQRSPGFILSGLKPGVGYGQFINYNHFAFLMELVFGVILGLIIGGGVRRSRLLTYLAILLPVWTALVLCNSRGGIFSMFCQILFLSLIFSTTRKAVE